MNYDKPFLPAEFRRRVQDVKQRMERAGFDLLICQDPANMSWLTGFDSWSFYTPQAVVVHLNHDMPIWFGRPIDSKSAHITTDLPAENIISFSEKLVHHPELHPFDELCQLIKSHGWGSDRIGVELDAHYYTARAHQHLVSGLPNAKIVDSRELVNWARLVKSEAELVYMREAGRIITNTMQDAIARLKPGVTQYEIAAEVYRSQIIGIDGKYGDYTSLCPLIQVGQGTSTPHLTWSDEKLPTSGLIVMELGAARRHYHTPLTRTVHIGKPPAEVSRLAKVIIEGGDAALESAKPGVATEEVAAVFQKVLQRNGYSKDSRVGYSIGINYPPDWGERTVSIRSGETTVLQEGMCFHFQSGVWLDDFGAAISEPFVVAEKGGQRLSNVDRRLFIVE
ncbi:M24 family metallopeptidase [Mesorhizobium sp.]|uniref:M24 family metallopeptidase n=1 Tax=Mesorhizobium sp. TaxID=1871066 RepID=UPI001201CF1F|nr:M24 family metallopeptidase [Mesorhizobium sp.]TIL34603.1 MAG: M24 family metallopeptidase [Mesorhizobium sp.]TIM48603.1 MAG: M24 family metallopeptidase [Mesorhizobium sp.]